MSEIAPKDLPYKKKDFKGITTLQGMSYDEIRAFSWHNVHHYFRVKLYDKNPMCWGCGEDIDSISRASLDHIVPKSKGGRTREMNLRLMHRKCNSRRNDRLPEGFIINPLALTPIRKHVPR